MKHLTLSFFSAFQATLNGKPLTRFRSVKSQGLLIYLVLNGQQLHTREVLATLFWPEEPEKTAKQNLRQSLFRLRKALGEADAQGQPFLLITHTTVQFNMASDHRLDVADFLAALAAEKLETAVSLYKGDLLPGFTCGSLPFDDWLRQEREQHHRLALNALFQLGEQQLAQADYLAAQQVARQQLALEPWREEAHRQLIQALALQGERSAAITQYEICRTLLADELGIAPSVETKTLLTRIRTQQPDHATSPKLDKPEPPQRLTIPFVGRKAEYEALISAYQQAISDGLQIVTLAGKSGIGKTRLTKHFLAWATIEGADILQSRAFDTSSGLSYQPITHLLRHRLERENAPEDLLSDLWLSQLTRLLPELRDRYPDLPEPTQEENSARQHLFEAITRLVEALAARQPLVLFIDDWQWADSASLDLLHYAAVRWSEQNAPILVLLTLREEAVSELPDLQSWLTHLNHATATVPLQLSALSQLETTQLIQQLLQPMADNDATPLTRFSDWLFRETDGQPLFLTETLKALVEEGLVRPETVSSPLASSTPLPNSGQAVWHLDASKFDAQMQRLDGYILPGILQIVRSWLNRITVPASKLLTAASILANEITFQQLCHVADLVEGEALTALDELLDKQLLLEMDEVSLAIGHEPQYRFSHHKVSEMVYAEAGAARRRILHRRAFEILQRETAVSARSVQAVSAADCAYHARHAGLLAETIHYSLVAGNDAMDAFAVQVAIPHYETAWQLVEQKGWPETLSGADREALYSGLGRAYELAEAWPQAQQIYQAMITYAHAIGAPAMESLGLNRLATISLFFDTDQQHVFPLLERARAIAERHGDRRGMAETNWNLAHAARVNDDLPLAFQYAEQALSIARELGHPQLLARSHSILIYNYAMQRKWEQVQTHATEAQQQSTAANNLDLAAESERLLGHSQMYLGRPQESAVTLQATLAFSQQIENLWGQIESGRMLAYTQLELGHYGQAIKLVRQAIKQAHAVGQEGITKFALITWGIVQRAIMDLEGAKKTFLTVLAEYTKQGSIKYSQAWVREELCTIHALAGAWGQAHHYARMVVEARGATQRLPMSLTFWFRVEALLRGGEEQLAHSEVAYLANLVGNNRRYQLPLLRSRAVLAQWDGEVAQAIRHLENALTLAQEMSLPGEEWPIWGELGRLYEAQGEDGKARQAYGEAAVLIRRLAETIDDEGLREGFLTAVSTQAILQQSE